MKKIPIAHPSITKNEINLVYDAIKNGWGNKCFDYIIKFEKLFSKKFNVNYSIATSSCTGAIHIALKSMGIGRGDEVIVPESTWISCASAIEYVGAKPVFADILEDTWCINPKDILKKINKRTKAIIPVHVYGSICEMDEINKTLEDTVVSLVRNLYTPLTLTNLLISVQELLKGKTPRTDL